MSEDNGSAVEKKSNPKSRRILALFLAIMVVANLGLAAWIAQPYVFPEAALSPTQASPTQQPAADTPTLPPTPTREIIPLVETPFPEFTRPDSATGGTIILSIKDGNFSHLFAYHPQSLPLTRLTSSNWDDITPATSPDGTKLVFSSRRNGYWDLYLLNLTDGDIQRLTDTPAYDASPTLSPDNQWIAYESYFSDNLEILIQSLINPQQPIIQLTESPQSADTSPAWSPQGRDVAFVSDRSGNEDIWLARLDRIDERFINISNSLSVRDTQPNWSPDGRYLIWSAESGGRQAVMVWDSQEPDRSPREVGDGSWPVWSPGGNVILAASLTANHTAISAFVPGSRELVFPLTRLPGQLRGMIWIAGEVKTLMRNYPFTADAEAPAPELWRPLLSVYPQPPGGRFGVVPLEDVTAPVPYLHDAVDESFAALRQQAGHEAGWDVLGSLEEAYLALTTPPTPGMLDNWLYTGRAVALNPLPLYAGWMAIVREDYEGQTYWRLYLKARFQDGSMGEPIKVPIWDMNARFSGDTTGYEQGGQYAPVPAGYWVDFSELASRFGWERLPALRNWRSFYPAARFNIYALRDGLDWQTAMEELYPLEALATPTPTRTYTPTITETPENFRTATPAPSATITPTATLNFTFTPSP